jgi:hypothetical protein
MLSVGTLLLVAFQEGKLSIYDIVGQELHGTITSLDPGHATGRFWSMAFCDEKTFATADYNNEIRIRRVDSVGTPYNMAQLMRSAKTFKASRDGRYIGTVCSDKILLWDVASGRRVHRAVTFRPTLWPPGFHAWDPDG